MTHTPGPWRDGNVSDCIVSDAPIASVPVDADTIRDYGGYPIAESIAPENKPLIKAAPKLLAAALAAFPWLHHLPSCDWMPPDDEPDSSDGVDSAYVEGCTCPVGPLLEALKEAKGEMHDN